MPKPPTNGWFPVAGCSKIHELVDALMKFVSVKEYEAFVEREEDARNIAQL